MTNSTLGPGIAMMTNAAIPKASSWFVETMGTGSVSQRPHQERPSISGGAGQHDGRLGVAPERQPLPQLLGDDVHAALLDRQPADPPFAQSGPQLLLVVRQLLEDLVPPCVRRRG